MSDLEPELDPSIVEALKRVPPADPDTRERHVSAALAHLASPATSRRATRWLARAAAVVALVGTGFAVGWSSSNDGNSGFADAGAETLQSTDSSIAVKGGAGAASSAGNDASSAAAGAACESDSLKFVALIESTDGWLLLYVRSVPTPSLVIMVESTCSVLREIDLP